MTLISEKLLPQQERLTSDEIIRIETPWNYSDSRNPLKERMLAYHKALTALEKEIKEYNKLLNDKEGT